MGVAVRGQQGLHGRPGHQEGLPFEQGLHQFLKSSHGALLDKIEQAKALDKDAEAELNTERSTAFKKSFA